jgi:hypothetical protein
MLLGPDNVDGRAKYKELADALDDDARVTDVLIVDPEGDFIDRPGVYRTDVPENVKLADGGLSRALKFDAALRFRVHVPSKNQPFADEEPPEDYAVCWDGYTAAVGWDQPSGEEWTTQAGGHVVADVFREAARTIGCELYVQGCDPRCTHMFAHTDLRITEVEAATEMSFEAVRWGRVHVQAPPAGGTEEVVYQVYREIRLSVARFTDMKNTARRMQEVEFLVRGLAGELMQLQLERADARLLGLFKRWRRTWELRSWRSQSRSLLARLWLGLATLESLKRTWSDERVVFEDETTNARTVLFDLDQKNDAAAVQSLDLSLVGSAVQEAAGRLDAGALTLATASAGFFGILGIIVGHFL